MQYPLISEYVRAIQDASSNLDKLVGCPVRCSEKQMLKSPIKLLI